jgi:hypothetical protein
MNPALAGGPGIAALAISFCVFRQTGIRPYWRQGGQREDLIGNAGVVIRDVPSAVERWRSSASPWREDLE